MSFSNIVGSGMVGCFPDGANCAPSILPGFTTVVTSSGWSFPPEPTDSVKWLLSRKKKLELEQAAAEDIFSKREREIRLINKMLTAI